LIKAPSNGNQQTVTRVQVPASLPNNPAKKTSNQMAAEP